MYESPIPPDTTQVRSLLRSRPVCRGILPLSLLLLPLLLCKYMSTLLKGRQLRVVLQRMTWRKSLIPPDTKQGRSLLPSQPVCRGILPLSLLLLLRKYMLMLLIGC